jgi:hypothetical protein
VEVVPLLAHDLGGCVVCARLATFRAVVKCASRVADAEIPDPLIGYLSTYVSTPKKFQVGLFARQVVITLSHPHLPILKPIEAVHPPSWGHHVCVEIPCLFEQSGCSPALCRVAHPPQDIGDASQLSHPAHSDDNPLKRPLGRHRILSICTDCNSRYLD